MAPNGRSPLLAIHLGSPFTIASSWAYVSIGTTGPHQHWGRGCSAQNSGTERSSFSKPSEFAGALRTAMSEARDIEILFALWQQNVETVRAINRSLKQDHLPKSGIASQLVGASQEMRYRSREAAARESPAQQSSDHQQLASRIDKSVLTIGETKRIRCKEHLRFVASLPCLICGRTPSHAHHLRHAQPRGLGLKVSDEFTVPLCATHHQHLHHTTKRIRLVAGAEDRAPENCARPVGRKS